MGGCRDFLPFQEKVAFERDSWRQLLAGELANSVLAQCDLVDFLEHCRAQLSRRRSQEEDGGGGDAPTQAGTVWWVVHTRLGHFARVLPPSLCQFVLPPVQLFIRQVTYSIRRALVVGYTTND